MLGLAESYHTFWQTVDLWHWSAIVSVARYDWLLAKSAVCLLLGVRKHATYVYCIRGVLKVLYIQIADANVMSLSSVRLGLLKFMEESLT